MPVCPTCGQTIPPDTLLSELRRARERLHLTQSEVGRRLAPPRSHAAVSDIERGETALTVELLRQLAAIYGTTATAMLAASETPPATTAGRGEG